MGSVNRHAVDVDAIRRRHEDRERAAKLLREHIKINDARVLSEVINNPAEFFNDKFPDTAELEPLAAPVPVTVHPLAATPPSAASSAPSAAAPTAVPVASTALAGGAATAPFTPVSVMPAADAVPDIGTRNSHGWVVWRGQGAMVPGKQIKDCVARIADPEVTAMESGWVAAPLSVDPFEDVSHAVKRKETRPPARGKRPAKVARAPAKIDFGKATAKANAKKNPVPAVKTENGLKPVAAPLAQMETGTSGQGRRVPVTTTKVAPGVPFYDGDEAQAPCVVITPADCNLAYPLVVSVDVVTVGQVLAIYGRNPKHYGLTDADLKLPWTNCSVEDVLAYAARLTEHINRARPPGKQIEPYRLLKNDEWTGVCLAGAPRCEELHGDGEARLAFSQAVCQWSAASSQRQRRPFHENPTRPVSVDSPRNSVNLYQIRGMYGNVVEMTQSRLDGSLIWSGGGYIDRPELLAATCCREPESAKAPWLGPRLCRDVAFHEYQSHEQEE